MLSHVRLSVTSWTLDHQDPLSKGFFRQDYWTVLPFPSPGYLPDPDRDQTWIACIVGSLLPCKQSPAVQTDSLPTGPPKKPKVLDLTNISLND